MDLKNSKHIRQRVHDNISKSENYYKPNEYIVLDRCEILFFLYLVRFIYLDGLLFKEMGRKY